MPTWRRGPTYVEVHWSAEAEAYVTPVGPDLVGVAVLTEHRGPSTSCSQASRRSGSGCGSCTVAGARVPGPLRQRSTRRVAGRVLLVGDASGYVDALTGEGIALGLAQARAAVAAIAADQPERYERVVAARHLALRLLTASLLGASRLSPVRRGHRAGGR